MIHFHEMIPKVTFSEQFVGPLLVEGAAHASVGGLHGKDGGTADAPALPHALLDHSCKFNYKV